MDNLFERFVRKLGIEDVLMYDTCYFASKKYDKEKDLLTIEIEQTGFFTYKAARTLLDAIDHAPFKVQVNFKYRNGFTEKQLYELLKDELNDVLLELTDREEKVLRLRFGLDDGRTRTLEEVGREFNVTRERIRQIEAKALRKLKHPSRSKRLKDFLDR